MTYALIAWPVGYLIILGAAVSDRGRFAGRPPSWSWTLGKPALIGLVWPLILLYDAHQLIGEVWHAYTWRLTRERTKRP